MAKATKMPPRPDCWRITLNEKGKPIEEYASVTKEGILTFNHDLVPRITPPVINEEQLFYQNLRDGNTQITLNEYYALARRDLARVLDDTTGKDIYRECGYPDYISPLMYKQSYARNGVGTRVVDIYPEEAMTSFPKIYETNDDTVETDFELVLQDLIDNKNLFHYMLRLAKLAGIGSFGGMLYGIDDGRRLNEPAEGVDNNGDPTKTIVQGRKINYYRVFDEGQIHISRTNNDPSSPRFGMPEMYLLQFTDPTRVPIESIGTDITTRLVHWTRFQHCTLNPGSNELYSPPEQELVWNRLMDVDKVLSGSGEMFWKGAFPGYAFETNPDLMDPLMDKESIKEEMDQYSRGLQRYIALTGMKVTSLTPQMGDPTAHVNSQLRVIAMAKKTPWRVFVGSEQSQLASEQDMLGWNIRLNRWLAYNADPQLVRPIIDRHILLGVLPRPGSVRKQRKKGDSTFTYGIEWDDLNTRTPNEQADWFLKYMQALSTAIAGGVDQMLAPEDILIEFGKIRSDKVVAMFKRAIAHLENTDGGMQTPALRQQDVQIEADSAMADKQAAAQAKIAATKSAVPTKPNNGGMR